ncbi:MAG: phenylacetate-CoA oxygenase subunit PaaC [Planctomycetes bacterium]|nr:phenylacetate-CoA oxygenase subunit PaaC [Planctomycetota bacterium]
MRAAVDGADPDVDRREEILMDVLPSELKNPLVDLLLSVADDKFILGHRNADWTGLAPMLEEDIAFSSLAQDDLAHAMALYEMVGGLLGKRGDDVAYGRTAAEYRCCTLVELHDEFDWAVAIARQFLCDHYEQLRLARLADSAYTPLRQLAARLLAEERLAIGHADQWVVRLGRGTPESRTRIQSALDRLAPLCGGLFEPTGGVAALESTGVFPKSGGDMFDSWSNAIQNVVENATLRITLARPAPDAAGGRGGKHSEAFAALLDELAEVYRTEPGAAW